MLDFASRNILIVGDVMIDTYCEGSVARVSPEAPVPVVVLSGERHVPGGAANVAANVAALGASGSLIGVVGEDGNAALLRQIMAARFPRISLDAMVACGRRPTTTKTRIIGNKAQLVRLDNERTVPIDPDVEAELLKQVEAAIPHCDAVVLSDYSKGACTDAVIRGVIALAAGSGKPLLVDPKRRDFSIYAGATILKPNLGELEAATLATDGSDESVERAARVASGLTGAGIIVTRSERGMSYVGSDDAAIHIPTAARTVFDVSGAGDTVIAALAVSINPADSSDGVAHAMAIANTAAGLVIAKAGTATVTAAEIAAEMARPTDIGGKSAAKIVTRAQARAISASWRAQGLTVGFTNGCFDLLHPGHVQLLERSAGACDRLIVGLNADDSVRRLKGSARPVQREDARAQVMAALGMVDLVVMFGEDTPAEIIEELVPDALMKGADYTVDRVVGAETVIAHGGRVVLIDLLPDSSTTALVKRALAGSIATVAERDEDVPAKKPGAVFFDRDGVLNVDSGYVGSIEEFQWIDGAREAIARLKGLGYLIFVVTNQSGVARGYYTEEHVRNLHDFMQSEVGGAIDAFHYCPYLPGATVADYDLDSPLRKPAPGMLLELLDRFDVDRDGCFMIGDRESDMSAATAAGVEGILFDAGNLDAFVVDHLRHKGLIA